MPSDREKISEEKIRLPDGLPRTLATIFEEGGNWVPFKFRDLDTKAAHAILFEDGHIWDVVNGWREKKLDGAYFEELKAHFGIK